MTATKIRYVELVHGNLKMKFRIGELDNWVRFLDAIRNRTEYEFGSHNFDHGYTIHLVYGQQVVIELNSNTRDMGGSMEYQFEVDDAFIQFIQKNILGES